MDLNKLEEMWDYSIALIEEISRDITRLSKYSSSIADNKLDYINRKIDRAREKWINVDSLDKQILDFRIILFKRDIANKIEEVTKENKEFDKGDQTAQINHFSLSEHSFNIDSILKEYEELKNEDDSDKELLNDKMKELYYEVERSRIKFMIDNIIHPSWSYNYTVDKVLNKLEDAENDNIDIDDLKEDFMHMMQW